MVIRRTQAAPAAVPRRPLPPSAPPPRQNVATGRSDFQAAAPAKVALSGDVRAPFVRPPRGEWTLDAKGAPSDPVTLYVHGSLDQLDVALSSAGWTRADPRGLQANRRYASAATRQEIFKALAFCAKRADGVEVGLAGAFGLKLHPWLRTTPRHVAAVDRMPVSPQTYRGQPLLQAYEQHNDPLGGRDHLRIFATGERDAQGREVYAIAASRDVGIRFAPDHPECAFLFHTVQGNVAAERELLLQSLQRTGHVAATQPFTIAFGGPSPIGESVGDGRGFELTLR
jgi:hypothetical protein